MIVHWLICQEQAEIQYDALKTYGVFVILNTSHIA